MSFEKLTESFNQIQFNSSSPQPHHYLNTYKKHNRQCMPSDDEDDDDSFIEKEKNIIKKHVYKPTTLPSDDDDTSDDDCLISKNSFIKPSQNSYKRTLRQTRSDASTNSSYSFSFKPHMNITRSAEDLPRMHHSNDDDDDNVVLGSRYQVMPAKPKVHMSGMDLLIQREQEKAKRQKPKTNVPGKVKIEGLLSKLPQPGTHNISFQQLQLQEKKQQQKQHKMTDYNNMKMPFNNHAMLYQLPSIPISNGSLYINNNSRPSSVISNNHKRRSSSHYIPFV